jgi:hypothetical protein
MTEEAETVPAAPSRGDRVANFANRFQLLCEELKITAAAFILNHPEIGQASTVGHPHALQILQSMLDKSAVAGFYRDQRQQRKQAAFAKRNPNAPGGLEASS